MDISHDVEKYRVRDAALLLWSAAPYLPVGAHVAVVDPGVGTERRAVAMETARGDHLVGPDNGILLPAAARLGGGNWDRVRSVRIGADWGVELRRLQTFGRLASAEAQHGRVYVDAPHALRIAAGSTGADLVWLDEEEVGESTVGRLEFLRRHQA